MIPMAISLGFGILFATSITLVIVPCLYSIAEDIRRFLTTYGIRKKKILMCFKAPNRRADRGDAGFSEF